MHRTPTVNGSLPFRTGGFETLVEGLDYAARGETGLNFHSSRGALETVLSYRELAARARETALRLPSTGLRRGDRVAIVAETRAEFLITFFACQYAGMVPVPLPLCVNFGGHDAYVERLRGMMQSAMARAAVGSADYKAVLEQASIGTPVSFTGDLEAIDSLPSRGVLEPLRADEPCYIQYSSGSTSFPRGVLVSQEAITANARLIAQSGIALRPGDRCTSWLPLYHDMGLVGCCLTPVLAQISVDYLETASFARRPMVWLKLLAETGGTISFSPTFGYELCARRVGGKAPEDLDLSRWRVAGIGGEMIRPRALREFVETFGAAGFDEGALTPSYGLAEATLAVTFSELGAGVRTDEVEQGEAFECFRKAVPASGREGVKTRTFAICGRPMEGYRVEIRDDLGRPLPDRQVGRVCIDGPSLMRGYFRNHDATSAVIQDDGWLDTGDMGYLIEGELVVTGRTKDLIILNGRNIWPQDIEWSVERIDGVRAGDVAAFAISGDQGDERMVVLVQSRAQTVEARESLRGEIMAVVRRACGAEAEVVLVPPKSLVFTTSGKLSRAAAKADYQSGRIKDVGETRASGEFTEDFALRATG